MLLTFQKDIQTPDATDEANYTGQIDLALLASQQLGRNVRQGQTFHIKKVSAFLRGRSGDHDMGHSVTAQLKTVPTTKISRKGWNLAFEQWKRQKMLSGKVGQYMRNDDFEVAYDASRSSPERTSSIYGSGMNDSSLEKVVLKGSSSVGVDFSIQDMMESQLPNMLSQNESASRDPFTNEIIKPPKFTTKGWPSDQVFAVTAEHSAMVTKYTTLGNLPVTQTHYFGASSEQGEIEFIKPIPSLCGIVYYELYVLPEDTAFQEEDNAKLFIQFHITRMTPLVYRPKPRKKKAYSSRGRKTRGRRYKRRN